MICLIFRSLDLPINIFGLSPTARDCSVYTNVKESQNPCPTSEFNSKGSPLKTTYISTDCPEIEQKPKSFKTYIAQLFYHFQQKHR